VISQTLIMSVQNLKYLKDGDSYIQCL